MDGVPQNIVLAYYWYRAARQGNAAAQHQLGLLYDKGQGRRPDHVLPICGSALRGGDQGAT